MPMLRRWSDAEVVEMRSMRAQGNTLKAIAHHFDWSVTQVWRVVVGKSYRKAGGVIAVRRQYARDLP